MARSGRTVPTNENRGFGGRGVRTVPVQEQKKRAALRPLRERGWDGKESFDGQNIGKPGHFEDFLNDLVHVGNLHAAFLAHGLMRGKQHPQTGG